MGVFNAGSDKAAATPLARRDDGFRVKEHGAATRGRAESGRLRSSRSSAGLRSSYSRKTR